jgi:hypothetical protein
MLEIGLSLAVLSAAIELAVVFSIPWLGRLLERHTLFSIAFSIAVSILIGTIFGAAGLLITFAAVLSTLLSVFVYRLIAAMRWVLARFSRKGVSDGHLS